MIYLLMMNGNNGCNILAVLELMKNQQIIIEQEHNFDEILYQAILNLHRVSIENG